MQAAEGTSSTIITDGALYVLKHAWPIYLIILIIIVVSKLFIKHKTYLKIVFRNKEFKFSLFPISRLIRVLVSFILLLLSLDYVYI